MVLVGDFNEEELNAGIDKEAVNKAMAETGLQYSVTRIIKKGSKRYLRIYVGTVEEAFNL